MSITESFRAKALAWLQEHAQSVEAGGPADFEAHRIPLTESKQEGHQRFGRPVRQPVGAIVHAASLPAARVTTPCQAVRTAGGSTRSSHRSTSSRPST